MTELEVREERNQMSSTLVISQATVKHGTSS